MSEQAGFFVSQISYSNSNRIDTSYCCSFSPDSNDGVKFKNCPGVQKNWLIIFDFQFNFQRVKRASRFYYGRIRRETYVLPQCKFFSEDSKRCLGNKKIQEVFQLLIF